MSRDGAPAPTPNLADEVRAALQRGWRLVPMRGKVPTVKGWTTREFGEDELLAHVENGGNVGIKTGAASGLVVVDLDGAPEQHATLLERLPNGPSVCTGSGGVHLFFRDPGGLKNSAGKYAEHVDIRADSGCVVMAGSVHPKTGRPYEWTVSPDEAPLPELPQWFLDGTKTGNGPPIGGHPPALPPGPGPCAATPSAYYDTALAGEAEAVAHTPEGQRNDRLNLAAYKLGGLGLDVATVESALLPAALQAGLPEKAARDTIARGTQDGNAAPRPSPEPRTGGQALDWSGTHPPGRPAQAAQPAQAPATGAPTGFSHSIEVVSWGQVRDNLPPLDQVVLEGVLRRGQKFCLVGPSKVGKTYCLLALAYAAATGMPWMGRRVERGNTIYINLEVSAPSLFHRVDRVEAAMGRATDPLLHIANLRGTSLHVEEVTTKLLPVVKKLNGDVGMVIVDPVYSLLNGRDENMARDVADMMLHLEHLAEYTGACVVFSHHCPKGAMGTRSPMDRAAGSGVFARSVDAMMMLSETDVPGDFLIDWICRDFPAPPQSAVRWNWPLHEAIPVGTLRARGASGRTSKVRPSDLETTLLELCDETGTDPTKDGTSLRALSERLEVSEKTVRRNAEKNGILRIEGGRAMLSDGGKK
ncbi:MAG: AAA family ATPase [Candidatus Hydrogenedentes bacterium]|nr:AAA family ATPase [Candidatus Hydrogenedentota bacterium]